jgi:hypothetical protein
MNIIAVIVIAIATYFKRLKSLGYNQTDDSLEEAGVTRFSKMNAMNSFRNQERSPNLNKIYGDLHHLSCQLPGTATPGLLKTSMELGVDQAQRT